MTICINGLFKKEEIRIGCLIPAFWGPTSGRKCYITPAFSGIPNKGDNIKATKKTKKIFSILSLFLSGVLQITPIGD